MTTENTQEDGRAAAEQFIENQMKRVRRNSRWNGLTFAQCEQVEAWLFEENLTYAQTAERVKQEFGVEASLWSVGRFYRYRARIQQTVELLEAKVAVDRLNSAPVNTDDMRSVAVKMLAKKAVRLATERPEDVEGLMAVTKVLLHSETNDIRLRRVKLEERYYDFEANAACAEELPKVRSYLRTVGDNEHLSDKDKLRRTVDLLYGKGRINLEEAESAESEEEPVEASDDAKEVADGWQEIEEMEKEMSGEVERPEGEKEPGDGSPAQTEGKLCG